MIRIKVDFTKQKIVRLKEDLGMNEVLSFICAFRFFKVTVVNTDVEKSLIRSFSNDLEPLISNFHPSMVSPLGDTNTSEILA